MSAGNSINFNGLQKSSTLVLAQVSRQTKTALKIGFVSSLCFFHSISHANSEARVLVIDQGADLAHEDISNFIHENLEEKLGKPGVDDSGDGFIDAVSGWNAVSNDHIYMPGYALDLFKKNKKLVEYALNLYSKMEAGDKTAREVLMTDPSLMQAIGVLLDLSHGTHVAGIVGKLGDGKAKLQSMNLFTPSKRNDRPGSANERDKPESSDETDEPNSNNEYRISILAQAAQIKPMNRFYDDLRKSLNAALNSTDDSPAKDEEKSAEEDNLDILTPPSMFDDKTEIDAIIAALGSNNSSEYDTMSRYIKAISADVVNLSLGTAKHQIRAVVEQFWQAELLQRDLPRATRRTAEQQENFDYLVNTLFEVKNKAWVKLFKANPNTLFVLAAGNEGDSENPELGNIELNPVTPSMISGQLSNAITVVATSQAGVIADFSNYSAKLANIGAWGVAVPSLAPDNNRVAMSGTSMAAPFVAGVAAKIRAINPKLKPAAVRRLIEKSGTQIGSLKGKTTSGALINPTMAYAAAEETRSGLSVDAALRKVEKQNPFRIRGSLIRGRGSFAGSADSPEDQLTQFGSNPALLDIDSAGKVHSTSPEVKRFLKRF